MRRKQLAMKPTSLLVSFALLCISIPSFSEGELTPPAFEVPNSLVFTIESNKLGRTYDIFVKTPANYNSDTAATKRYPVIYLNDGPYTFQVASGATHLPMNSGKLASAILVGISFAHGEDGMDSRVRDLTPTQDKDWQRYKTGGGPAYLEFIEKEVFPFIESRYRTDPKRRTLAGQSLGGSFGVWVLLTHPELFESYILTSSSLWFHDRIVFQFEEAYAKNNEDLKARVYFAVGEHENPVHGNTIRDMVGDQSEFVKKLRSRNYPGLVIKDEIINEAIHETTFPIGFTRGVRWIFDK